MLDKTEDYAQQDMDGSMSVFRGKAAVVQMRETDSPIMQPCKLWASIQKLHHQMASEDVGRTGDDS